MNWQQLKYFETLAETQHFTKAAEQLFITQPALSKAIKSLEDEIGVPLFEQSGRNIKLTRFGKIFNNHVRLGLKEIDKGIELLHSMVGVSQGTINIGAIHSMMSEFVPRQMSAFLKEHQQVKFFTRQQSTMESLDYLQDNVIDLAFTAEYETDIYPDLDGAMVCVEEINLAVPATHPLAGREQVKLAEVLEDKFIHYNQTTGMARALDELLQQAGYNINQLNVAFLATEGNAILGMVRASLGIAFVVNTPNINASGLSLLKIADLYFYRKMYMSWKRAGYMAPVVKAFRNYILNAISSSKDNS